MTQIILTVTGMNCTSCATKVEKSVTSLPGVKHIEINMVNNKTTITYDDSEVTATEIITAIKHLGYDVLTQKTSFTVSNINCASCAAKIETTLRRIPQIIDVSINEVTKQITVEYLTSFTS